MNMLLKSIDLQGYKTFAGRTNFEFPGAITCIVGPNGSGKSNIADAIRWVLGEQSYSLLRGRKTEDMIFSGSESRPRAGMASANIIFDNTSGWLPVDYSEVSIARRAYRDGTNEYLLNGQRVRLKDISELLASSGLSERTYTIIGQGLVDAALSLRAEERRALFEEAAGIGLYRTRWEEAKRRLATTYRNLERVEDILAELRPRLRSLERQARRAGRYEQVEKDLKVLLFEYYGYHWYRTQRELNQAREALKDHEVRYNAVEKEKSELDGKLSIYREEVQRTRARLGSWHREMSHLHNQRETITRDLAVYEERLRSLNNQKQNTQNEYARLGQQRGLQQERLKESVANVENFQEELGEARAQLDNAARKYEAHQAEQLKAEMLVADIRDDLTALLNQENRLQARITERETQNARQQKGLEAAEQAATQAEAQLVEVETDLSTAKEAHRKLVKIRQEAVSDLEAQRNKVGSVQESLNNLTNQLTQLSTEAARLQAKLDVLDQAEKALSGYANGTRLLLKSAQDGSLSGVEGALSGQLDVPEQYEVAIMSALGEYLDAVLLGDEVSADGALEMLVKAKTKGALLPVDGLTPPMPLIVKKTDGMIGLASDIVKASPRLRPAVDLLLGQTLIVRDRKSARLALRGADLTTRAVTLQGELFNASGSISVGQAGESSTISRPRQRRELLKKIQNVENQQTQLVDQIHALEAELTELNSREVELGEALNQAEKQEIASLDTVNQLILEVERTTQKVDWHQQQCRQLKDDIQAGMVETREVTEALTQVKKDLHENELRLKEAKSTLINLDLQEQQSQVNYWRTQVAVKEQALANGSAQQEERRSALTDIDQNLLELDERMTNFESQVYELNLKEQTLRLQEAEIIQKIDSLRVLIDPAEMELDRLEREQDDLQKTETSSRQELSKADRSYSQAQLTLTRKQELLDNMRERIENDLGLVSLEYDAEISGPTPLPFSEMVTQLPRKKELADGLEEDIKRLRAQLRRMGSINPEAQTEFKDVSERFNFMTSQVEDLHKAEVDIQEIIAELDSLMKKEFHKTFDLVAKEFKEIFTRLFGGGAARLLLTDPGDLAETGIDIEARLPGRRSQGLSLLSGGERSLAATALVFSLLKVSPTPFCVLDEVDAMLDEANVERFRDLLRDLAENTQFIVITHNRNTVQAADVIYGVTMGRDSSSQMISLKLDEVSEIV